MEQAQKARDRALEKAWARAEEAAVVVVVSVPALADIVFVQSVENK
jgi:hypothetical protein